MHKKMIVFVTVPQYVTRRIRNKLWMAGEKIQGKGGSTQGQRSPESTPKNLRENTMAT